MRMLRFRFAGHLFALSLWVMPRGRIRDTLIDAVSDWRDEIWAEAQ